MKKFTIELTQDEINAIWSVSRCIGGLPTSKGRKEWCDIQEKICNHTSQGHWSFEEILQGSLHFKTVNDPSNEGG